jgi:hypothetical protein
MPLLLLALVSVFALVASAPVASADSFVDSTPGTMAFAVPAGVDSLTVAATGGSGGNLTNGSGTILVPGGRAAVVTAQVTVFPGEQLQLTVASNGGTASAKTGTSGEGGKPDGGAGGYSAGGGGGATRVLGCEGVTCSVAVIAGGGGGAGSSGYIATDILPVLSGGPGGAAGVGGTDGVSDTKVSGGSGGQPGSAVSAGAGGPGYTAGGDGSGPMGGGGGNPGPFNGHEGGGGGGGGVFGGGGGGSGNFGMDASLDQAYAGGGGGGGGSSLVLSGASLDLATPGSAPGIVLTWAAPGGPGQGGDGVAVVSRMTLSPSAFPAAPRGPSALVSARRRYGSKVAYTLNEAADVRFRVIQRKLGRRSKGGHCTKPTSANRSARKCIRRVTLPGSFTRAGGAGSNHFRFTGRLAGRRLKPGNYRLVATPGRGANTGHVASVSFRIIA